MSAAKAKTHPLVREVVMQESDNDITPQQPENPEQPSEAKIDSLDILIAQRFGVSPDEAFEFIHNWERLNILNEIARLQAQERD